MRFLFVRQLILGDCPQCGLNFSASFQSDYLSLIVLPSYQGLALGDSLWEPSFPAAIFLHSLLLRITSFSTLNLTYIPSYLQLLLDRSLYQNACRRLFKTYSFKSLPVSKFLFAFRYNKERGTKSFLWMKIEVVISILDLALQITKLKLVYGVDVLN